MAVLLGRTSAGTTADFSGSGHTAAWPFVASASGTLARIFAQTKVVNTGSGHRLGIYSHDAGLNRPGSLLGVASVDTGTPTGTGVFSAAISPGVSIVSGTTYWLGWYQTGDPFNFQGDSSGSYRETNAAADFPNPFGSESTSTVNAIIWGEDAGGAAATSFPFRKRQLERGLIQRAVRSAPLWKRRNGIWMPDRDILVPAY